MLKTAYDSATRQYTVTFNPMSYVVHVEPSELQVRYHYTFDEPTVSGVPSGVTLNGWFTEDGNRWSFASDIIEHDMTLFAHWNDETKPWISAVTRISYNTFSFTARDNVGIAAYAVTETTEVPSDWTSIPGAPVETTIFHTITHSGSYYIWVKDVAEQYTTTPEQINAYQINITHSYIKRK